MEQAWCVALSCLEWFCALCSSQCVVAGILGSMFEFEHFEEKQVVCREGQLGDKVRLGLSFQDLLVITLTL